MSTTKVRAALAGVDISFGLLSLSADLVPAQKSKASKAAERPTLRNVCPTCTDAVALKQVLSCPAHKEHGPFGNNDAAKAVEVDGVLRRVEADEVAQAKAPAVESKTVTLSAVHAPGLEAATMPSGNIYRLRLRKPSAGALETYAVLRDLARDPGVALIGELVVKGVTQMYRVIVHNDVVTFAQLVRPDQFNEPEPIEASCSPAVLEAGRALVAASVAEFDPVTWEDRSQARLQALKAGLAPEPAQPTEAAAAADDLLALLARSVADAA